MNKLILLFVCLSTLVGFTESKSSSVYDPKRAQQEFELADKQIKSNNGQGLLTLYRIATESMSAEDSEIAAEELRGYLYSKTDLWVKVFAQLEPTEFRKRFEITEIGVYRFTPDGEVPIEVAADRIIQKLKSMKETSDREKVLITYLVGYYSKYLHAPEQRPTSGTSGADAR